MKSSFVLTGTLFILTGIVLGAFGAHALQKQLTIEELDSFQTGVQYQLYHGLALLVLGFNFDKIKRPSFLCWGIALGTVLFSGSIYLLALDALMGIKLRFLWPVTPLGGILLIVSWGTLVYQLIRKN